MIFGSKLGSKYGLRPTCYLKALFLTYGEKESSKSISDELWDGYDYTFCFPSGKKKEVRSLEDLLPENEVTPAEVYQGLEDSQSEFILHGLTILTVCPNLHRTDDAHTVLCVSVASCVEGGSGMHLIPILDITSKAKALEGEVPSAERHRGYYDRWAVEKILRSPEWIQVLSPVWAEHLKRTDFEEDHWW